MNIIRLLLFCFLIVSCKKKLATEFNADFAGNWIHLETLQKYKILNIEKNSKGYIWYSEGWWVYGDTQVRKWFIKDNYLYFGRVSGNKEKFKIDQYPTISNSVLISGIDTVKVGQTYMILENNIFRK